MSTEDLGSKSSQTGGLKRLSKLGGTQPKSGSQPTIVEQVPGWLKRLLTQYGENEGRLVGLGEGPPEAEEMAAAEVHPPTEGGNLSALLEQMADEGVSDFPQGQRTSSVEWGNYTEPPAAPIDDLLAQLDPQQTDYPYEAPEADAPDWITGMLSDTDETEPPYGYSQSSQPAESPTQDDIPDWLTEEISTDEPTLPPSTRLADAPDWLTEALEAPSTPSEISPPYAAPAPSTPAGSSADSEVPDWLTAALETPEDSPSLSPYESGQPPTSLAQSDYDIPDWLGDAPGQPLAPSSTSEEPPDTVDVPDWLESIVSPPGLEEADSGEDESTLDVPDWLADIAPPVADELEVAPSPAASEPEVPAWSTPDWTAEGLTDETEAEAKSTEGSQETPSWFTQDETLPSLDWLFEAEPASTQLAEEDVPVEENADWLFDAPAPTPTTPSAPPPASEPASQPSEAEVSVPSWLEDLQVTGPAATQESSAAIPDWLNTIQDETLETPTASSDQPPTWLGSLQTYASETAETELDAEQSATTADPAWLADVEEETPAWLTETDAAPAITSGENEATDQPASPIKSLKPLKRFSPKPTPQAEASPPLPDWAAHLVPADAGIDETPPTLPAWAADLVPPGAAPMGPALLTLPDWTNDLVPPDIAAKEAPAAAEASSEPTTLRPLQRLSRLSKPTPETPPEITEAETPSWPTTPPTSSEQASPSVSEADWLNNLSAKADEAPDWMAELSGSTLSEAESHDTSDDWFLTEPSTEEEDLLAERLDWFTQDRQEQTPAAPAAQLGDTSTPEADTPDWFTDSLAPLSSEESPGSPVQSHIPETEEEMESLDWLMSSSTDFDEASASSVSMDSPEIAEEVEMPPWLADFSEVTAAATDSSPLADIIQDEEEGPAWLNELPGVSKSEATDETIPEVEPETPSWLADLDEGPVASPSIFDADAEVDEELDTPSWLTDLLGTPEAEPTLSTPGDMAGSIGETEAEPETPPWLTELPEAATTEAAPITPIDEIDDELEMPPWLTKLPEASDVEAIDEAADEAESDTLSWLTGLDEAPPTEPASTAWVEETEAETEELGLPSWLTELPEASAAEVESETTEAEPETPSWLTELPEIQAAEAMPPALAEEPEEENELETLPWLVGLAAEAVDTAETEAEEETPSWLSELPEASEAETASAAAVQESEAEAELEIPSWLSELPEASEAETASAAVTEESEAEAELEMPSWLSELPEASEAETASAAAVEEGEAEAELEIPSWLSELPEEPEATSMTSVEETEETEQEIPSWLLESSENFEAEAAPAAFSEETETEELEIPSWLAELPEAPETEPAYVTSVEETEAETEESELPSWLTELPEASATEAEPEAIEAEPETPSWLSELPEATAEAEAMPPVLAEETEEELEIPPWLVGLAGAATAAAVTAGAADTTETETEAESEQETLSWLTESPEESVVEAAPVPSIDEPDAEAELEMPSWLSELPEESQAETAPVTEVEETDAEAELEMPSWLSELSEESQAETASAVEVEEADAEAELEIPSWLSELPEASEAETASAAVAEEAGAEAELEMPAWLSELPEASETETASAAEVEETDAEAELEMPSWLSELPEVSEAETASAVAVEVTEVEVETEATDSTPIEVDEVEAAGESSANEAAPATLADEVEGGEALDLPPWLADLSTEELKMPSWLSDLPELTTASAAPTAPVEEGQAEEELEVAAGQVDLSEDIPAEEPSDRPSQPAEADESGLSESGWLAGLGAATEAVKAALPAEEAENLTFASLEDEPETPVWLLDTETAEIAEPEAPEDLDMELPDVEPEAPDWLKDFSDDETSSISSISPAETKPSPAERMSDWLRNLKPTEEALTDEDNSAIESTGVLAGLAPLLPAEKIATATPLLDPHATASAAQADAMLEAARNFYAIATQPPQPALLPESLTQSDQLIGNVARAALYLLFIILVALPLVPGWQKVVDPASGQMVPWTEPAGALNEVLDKQRRELISVQLGVIDLQQPGSVALVSFDYSAATQGEMQPLAEAIIGRLRGQAMRLIFVSLEPEGAALAQRTLDKILAERNEVYGDDMVNLGYVPGQVTGIRELVSGRKQLSALTDFKEGLTFAAPQRTAWNNVDNLGQVDVVITLSDNPATARWWIEQMAGAIPADDGERFLLAATSATADPFLRPYLDSQQLDGLISGINGAAAIEAGRKNFGPARQMLDSQGIAHLLMVILIALGTMVGWMPPATASAPPSREQSSQEEIETEEIG